MARKRRHRMEEPSEPLLDISSLIDVSFLLLIYFIVTSTIQRREQDLGLVLPSDSQPTEADTKPMPIKITEGGEVVIYPSDPSAKETVETDPDARELPNLLESLIVYKQGASLSKAGPIVILIPEDSSKSQRFMDVLNCLAKAKITQVTLAGFKEKESS